MLKGIEQVLLEQRPDCVLIYGDTNSTLAGAPAASKLSVTGGTCRGRPAELQPKDAGGDQPCRGRPSIGTPAMSQRYGGTQPGRRRNYAQCLPGWRCDAGRFKLGEAAIRDKPSPIFQRLGVEAAVPSRDGTPQREYRRPGAPTEVLRAFNSLQETIVFPIHPRARKMIADGVENRRSHASDRPCRLPGDGGVDGRCADGAARIRAACRRKPTGRAPCVTIREETEWVETVAAGWNRLAGASRNQLWRRLRRLPPTAAAACTGTAPPPRTASICDKVQ